VALSTAAFLRLVLANPVNAALLERLRPLALPDCYLTAGCLFQAVWNARCGREAGAGVRDYDVFYWNGADLSWEAEDAVIGRVAAACRDLDARVEVRNQARVHLWFEQHFGHAIPPLASSRAGIDRFLMPCCAVGIEVATGVVYAPFGLDDTWSGVLRPNPRNGQLDLFARKAADYRARWPFLTIAG
jgi:hypothetical protein